MTENNTGGGFSITSKNLSFILSLITLTSIIFGGFSTVSNYAYKIDRIDEEYKSVTEQLAKITDKVGNINDQFSAMSVRAARLEERVNMRDKTENGRMLEILKDSFQGFVSGVITSVGILVIALPVLNYGPEIETKYWPVLGDFTVDRTVDAGEYTIYDVSYTKYKECDVIGTIWLATDKNGNENRILVEFPFQPDNMKISRPLGDQKSTGWKVYNKDEAFTKQRLIFYHNCHVGWKTKTEIDIK